MTAVVARLGRPKAVKDTDLRCLLAEEALIADHGFIGTSLRDVAAAVGITRAAVIHHFGTKEHAWIWKVISETWNSYRERATGRIISGRARDDFPDEVKRKPYLSLAVKLIVRLVSVPELVGLLLVEENVIERSAVW